MLKPNKRATTRDHERVSTSDSQIARNCVQLYGITNGADFAACLVEAIRAINNGIYPDRIQQGSSGSYFVKNLEGETIGVFKPKNEEPYETLNPKWIKCMHRLFFPCCFGRSCLVPNQGYLSEAGAYLIDKRLGLNVVPKTAVVSFAAPTFNYNRMARTKARAKERIQKRYPGIGRHFRRIGLPPKRGSFQLFVHGYKDATYWLRQWEQQPEKAPPTETMQEFQQEFERMVILDYIIRNTDRGHDNWLIKYEQEELEKEEQKAEPSSATVLCKMEKADSQTTLKVEANGNEEISEEFWESVAMPRVKIAAIDNGLAFPFKHPDKWRAYPFRWANLPFAQKPFSEEIVHQVLPLIDNTDFVRRIGNDLRKIFKTDKGFHKRTFAKQLTVIRGQMFNLREALRTRQSPAQLAQMKPQYIIEIKKKDKRKKKKRHGGRKKRRRNVAAAKKPVVTHVSSTSSATTTTLRPGLEEEPPVAAPALTNDEVNDPKSWHNTFQQKMHRRSPFFAIC